MVSPLAAVFVGSDTLLLQCLDSWRERGHAVVAVATDTDKVRRYCTENGLRCLPVDANLSRELAGEALDYLFAITWLQILPAEILALPRVAAINFHDGPLPRYAGLNATCWSIHNGEAEHGVTWHRIEAKADTGDVLLQKTFAIAPEDTAFTLNARCFEHGVQSFGELCDRLLASGGVTGQPQDLGRRSYFGRAARPQALAVVDFAQPAAAVARLVRAFDHGGYPNPIAIAKVRTANGWMLPGGVEILPDGGANGSAGGRPEPFTVVAADGEGVVVACADAEVRLSAPRCLRGLPISADGLRELGVVAGEQLPVPALQQRDAWTDLGAVAAVGESAWVAALRAGRPLPVPDAQLEADAQPREGAVQPEEIAIAQTALADDVDVARSAARSVALSVAFLLRNAGALAAEIGFADSAMHAATAESDGLGVLCPGASFELAADATLEQALASIRASLASMRSRGPLLQELVARRPDALQPNTVLSPSVRVTMAADVPVAAGTVTFAVAASGSIVLRFDANVLPSARAQALAQRFSVFLRAAVQCDQAATRLFELPTLDEQELRRLLEEWNETDAAPSSEPCVHRQFVRQAQRTPEAVALRCGGEQWSYSELLRAVERLAGWLRGRGVQVGDRVGICTQRGFGMVVAVLASMRCGAAYVPLDPEYPRERLSFMAADAELAALVVDRDSLPSAPTAPCPRVDLDADADMIAGADVLLDDQATGEQLAYMIYTSGSTGRPKGVMVRHRNASNFFVGMDHVLGADVEGFTPGVWLAVTSLSFDISVLELLWTLCRGFEVVLHVGGEAADATPEPQVEARPISFSMFYFASDEGEHAEDKYRLLLEGAKFADQNGFEAVWTPERHFHAFGGLYPNPAVASAAIAAITKNVQIRAGSCVATLHHPIRIAEDWSLVDNLSGGRVGIAFAAGWHGRDFVLKPETFADRKNVMMRTIEQVHALWRGEELEFPGHDGTPHKIRTLPRPIQKRLPTWVTVAGNPETYRMAGASGSYVLTHLLGQSVQELEQKLDVYRQAWRAAGHEGEGKVTLMLHTFVGDDDAKVREIVRGPMKEYLRSSLDLVKQAAWSFPAFKNRVDKPGEMDELLNGGLTPADFEALLDFSFERYYQQSGLFGTPETCVQTVDRLRAIQVDEIACLVDFGVPTEHVMQSLPHLIELKRRCDNATAAAALAPAATPQAPAETIPQLITRHKVTHFQCTPSMAGMLMLDGDTASALPNLQHMLVGGEALPGALARQLHRLVPKLHDVYGPTETTVWSTCHLVDGEEPVPIGRPLRNQRVYVLDDHLQPVPTGSVGELWIGGAGVTAGYFRRPELTDERFRPDPFGADAAGASAGAGGAAADGAKIYGTGDLVRFRDDGVLEYLGRKDLQVKLRGYRIELGEIEAALSQHAGIREVVVVAVAAAAAAAAAGTAGQAEGGGGETRLVAYYVPRSPAPAVDALREHVRASLPEFMVPSHFVAMADLPRTPNLKIDRKALPAPEQVAATSTRPVAAAADDTEDAILAIWKQALGIEDVGVEDNFFDSGGHSILAVKVHREIVQRLGADLQVTDLFRFTTVRALARHLQVGKSTPTAAQKAMERAKSRRRNLLRRN